MSLEASRRLVERLLRPDAYSHPVSRIQLKETHISWVLLTGEYAYKIKKPVKLDFLDFSTLERRRFFCDEELRLNRKFASEIYLETVPIHGPAASPRVGGEGNEPIEYAVRLQQFDQRDELGELLERQAVSEEDLQNFGQRLADMHAAAASSRDFSSSEQTCALSMANLAELAGALGGGEEQLNRISTWLEERLRRLSPLIDARREIGKVRECHGDLHAGNVVRLHGSLAPFDCIEFDPALRFIDTVSDAAFLMMDLTARGHRALAYAFINGWLEGGGEYEGVPLLRVFEVHRALVRAKVAALEAGAAHAERGTGESERQQARASAATGKVDRYLGIANELCQERKPLLIVACGLSGSGKTWLSTRVMTAFGALRVRSDVERKRMAGLKAHESSRSLPGPSIYAVEFNDRVYGRLREVARLALTSAEHIIIDAASLRCAERESFIDLAAELDAGVSILYCSAPLGVLRSRLKQRQATGKDASEADVDVLERQLERWEEFSERERPYVIEIGTSAPDPVGRAVRALHESQAAFARRADD